MNNLSHAIETLEKHVNKEKNKFGKILSIYKEMINHVLTNTENKDNENLIDEIHRIGAIVATLFYIFDFKNQAKHTTLSTTRLSNITEKSCKKYHNKMCIDCWKLSYLYCTECLNLQLVHECNCQFNCCEI
jgi:hypothetical protein